MGTDTAATPAAPPRPAPSMPERRRPAPARGRIATRLRRAFWGLGAAYALALLIAWTVLIRVESKIDEIADYAEPLSAATYEMEINIIGSGMAVMKYLHRPDPAFIAHFQEDEADFQHFFEVYTGLVRTPEERALAGRVDELRLSYFGIGRRLISLRDGLSANYHRLAEVAETIEMVADDKVMARIIDGARNKSEARGILSALRAELAEMGFWFAAIAGGQSGLAKEKGKIEIDHTQTNLALLEDIAETAESRDAVARLSTRFHGIKSAAVDIVAADEAIGGTTEAFIALRGALDDVLDDGIQVLTGEAIAGAQREAERGAELALIALSALGVFVFLVATIGAYRVNNSVVGPLGRLSEAAHALSAGRLDHRLRIDRKDEIGDVARAFDIMAAKLQDASADLETQVRDRTHELAEANVHLLEELDRRAKIEGELLAARDTALAADRSKSEFLAGMSHELRTPLNAVIGFSEIMSMEALGPLGSARYLEYASDIGASGRHLLGIINDILDLSKVEAGEFTLNEAPVEVSTALETALHEVALAGAAKRLRLVNNAPAAIPCLMADPMRLHQILLNLLSNAVKFTEAGGCITAGATVRADAAIAITIEDTGIGMRREDIPKALAPFAQIDSRLARKYTGTGLGLPLTKSLVELHGGELAIESEPGVGTTCTLVFPPQRTLYAPRAARAG